MLQKKGQEEEKQEAGADGGGWLNTTIFGGRNPRTGRRQQGMGEMIAKEFQRSVSRSAATIIKNIILKSLGLRRR
jgi:hypothetical protein